MSFLLHLDGEKKGKLRYNLGKKVLVESQNFFSHLLLNQLEHMYISVLTEENNIPMNSRTPGRRGSLSMACSQNQEKCSGKVVKGKSSNKSNIFEIS